MSDVERFKRLDLVIRLQQWLGAEVGRTWGFYKMNAVDSDDWKIVGEPPTPGDGVFLDFDAYNLRSFVILGEGETLDESLEDSLNDAEKRDKDGKLK